MTYFGAGVTQIDGSWAQGLNCVLASVSKLGDCSTLGFYKEAPSKLRTMSGDTSGGVTYTLAQSVMDRATNGEVKLTVLYWAPQNSTTSTLDDLLDARRITGISIEAGITRYTPYKTGNFNGGHTVVAGAKRIAKIVGDDGKVRDQKQVLVMDPGHSKAKWVWWPWDLLIRAAKTRTGSNSIHVIYTRDLTNVSRAAKQDGYIRSTPEIKAGNIVGRVYKNKLYFVRDTIGGKPWKSGSRVGIGWSKLGDNKFVAGSKVR